MWEPIAADVMSTDVLSVPPDMTVSDVAAFFAENQITGAPVMDSTHRLLGMVSVSDVSESDVVACEIFLDRGVRDIMTPTVYTIEHDVPVSRVARTMIAGRLHRLLVVRDERVVGIVTSLDLLKLIAGKHGSRRSHASAGTGRGRTHRSASAR